MRTVPVIVAIALLAACGEVTPEPTRAAESAPAKAPAPPPKSDDRPVIVAFGDSLTAGYGLDPGASYPGQLQRLLDERGLNYRVVNEGVNGDTTSTGLSRLQTALSHDPKWVIVALGANDGLRGLSVETMELNLRRMVEQAQQAGARVALAGMTLPPNYGDEYIAEFEAVFPRIARDYTLPLLPFLLDGVAAEPDLNQDDGIHPTAEGAQIVADHVADFLVPLLRQDEVK